MSLEQPTRTSLDPTTDPRSRARSDELRCQWCSVALAPGSTVCPTCGSHGIPDPQYAEPDIDARAALLLGVDMPSPDMIAPWRDEVLAEPTAPARAARPKMTVKEAESRQKQTLMFVAASAVVCIALGWLAGPLLAGFIESFTGTPVEDTGDLRPMGAMLGLMSGLFIGGVGGIVIWANR